MKLFTYLCLWVINKFVYNIYHLITRNCVHVGLSMYEYVVYIQTTRIRLRIHL
jgi:hypothetical protein